MIAELPPHDIQAEDAVIGSVIIDSAAVTKASSIITADDFYRECNRWCFEAAEAIVNRGEVVDQLTIAHELEAQKHLGDVGGMAYLSYLVSITPTSVHVEHYAGIVKRTARLRQGIHAGTGLTQAAYDSATDPDRLAGQFVEAGLALRKNGHNGALLRPMREFVDERFNELNALYQGGAGALGIRTGWGDLDRLLGALKDGKFYVVCARTSMGKTQLLMQLAYNAAHRGIRVVVFSLEEIADDIINRLVAIRLGYDWTRLEDSERPCREAEFSAALGEVSDLPIDTTDAAALSVGDMLAQTTVSVTRGHKIGLVLVDYLNLASDDAAGRGEPRALVVDRICTSLKRLARELQVPVVAAAQLNREPEHRSSHEPVLSDVRESGGIEQTADALMLLYRPWYYVERGMADPADVKPKGWEGDDAKLASLLRVNVAKNRGGPIGFADLFYNPALARIGGFTRSEATR